VKIEDRQAWETADGYWRLVLRSVGKKAFFSLYHARTLVASTPDMAEVEKILGDQVHTLREVDVEPEDAA
jgi:hypothetical protein